MAELYQSKVDRAWSEGDDKTPVPSLAPSTLEPLPEPPSAFPESTSTFEALVIQPRRSRRIDPNDSTIIVRADRQRAGRRQRSRWGNATLAATVVLASLALAAFITTLVVMHFERTVPATRAATPPPAVPMSAPAATPPVVASKAPTKKASMKKAASAKKPANTKPTKKATTKATKKVATATAKKTKSTATKTKPAAKPAKKKVAAKAPAKKTTKATAKKTAKAKPTKATKAAAATRSSAR